MKRLAPICVFAACLVSVSACNHPKEAATPTAGVPAGSGDHANDLQAVVEGNNQFAFDLYARLGEKPGNKFFSPYSISTALAMTYAGARGNTAKEMAQTLHFTLDNQRLHPAFGALIRTVQGAGQKRNYALAVANRLWGNIGLALDPGFLRITQTDYQAGFEFADFVNDAEGARQSINRWVEDQTNKKIEELFPKGLLDQDTRLVLANAIYFKGDWSEAFPKEATRPDNFTIPGAPAFQVPMMHHAFLVHYAQTADFELAQLMYKDNDVSMVVILPRKKDGLPEVEKKLSAKTFAHALAQARAAELDVARTKFTMTEAFDLPDDLDKLGMHDAFGPAADFTGMDRSGSLSISAVLHKEFVERLIARRNGKASLTHDDLVAPQRSACATVNGLLEGTDPANHVAGCRGSSVREALVKQHSRSGVIHCRLQSPPTGTSPPTTRARQRRRAVPNLKAGTATTRAPCS